MAAAGRLERLYHSAAEQNQQVILDALPARPGAVVLDLGCADGVFTTQVADRVGAARTLGFELIEDAAERARSRGIEVTVGDLAARLPYDDGSIDVVHSNQVIEHLPFTDHFMSEIHRVMRPGGKAVVSTNNLSSWHNVASLVAGWQPTPCHVSDEVIVGNPANMMEGVSGSRGQMHLRVFTGRALAALARHHGLEVELELGAGYYPLPPRVARLMARLDSRHAAFLVQRYVRPERR
jgi:2-polyprenyl-3-methyl-5-hydroxy-6-metoxy-1,4-benzoquinol methylase